jgi:hypothetical protein
MPFQRCDDCGERERGQVVRKQVADKIENFANYRHANRQARQVQKRIRDRADSNDRIQRGDRERLITREYSYSDYLDALERIRDYV